MLNVSTLLGARSSQSDALRYGMKRPGADVPTSSRHRRPVVVWNSTRACNLACTHCYASARLRPADDELTTEEARAFLEDLAAYGVPAVLLSGGEPLARPDLLDLIAYGASRGLRFTLSSNGTLIGAELARTLARLKVTYVGISIDGDEASHDRLRRMPGAWRRSVEALRHLRGAGVRRGVRYTLTPANVNYLGAVLDLVRAERIERLCVYHLVPAGRGARLHDISPEQRRDALIRLFEFAAVNPQVEVLTVGNPSDGPFLYRWLLQRDPEAAGRCRGALLWNRGARHGPGVGLAAVDERGDVHPDQFSRHRTFGNVRQQPFSVIWSTGRDAYLQALRSPDRPFPDRCQSCPYLELCGGGLRSRAELAAGDPWAFDPSCSLISEEAA